MSIRLIVRTIVDTELKRHLEVLFPKVNTMAEMKELKKRAISLQSILKLIGSDYDISALFKEVSK